MPGFEAENRAMRRLATVILMAVMLSVAAVAESLKVLLLHSTRRFPELARFGEKQEEVF